MCHVNGYCIVNHDNGMSSVYCHCGWSVTRDTPSAVDRDLARHHAEQSRNTDVVIAPARPGRRWSNREIDQAIARIRAVKPDATAALD